MAHRAVLCLIRAELALALFEIVVAIADLARSIWFSVMTVLHRYLFAICTLIAKRKTFLAVETFLGFISTTLAVLGTLLAFTADKRIILLTQLAGNELLSFQLIFELCVLFPSLVKAIQRFVPVANLQQRDIIGTKVFDKII